MRVKIRRLFEDSRIPTKTYPSDACYDIFCHRMEEKYGCLVCYTGIAMEPPEGYSFEFYPRSSLSKTGLSLANHVGILDTKFRGEVQAWFRPALNFHNNSFSVQEILSNTSQPKKWEPIKVGDRIGQIKLVKDLSFEFEESQELMETDRGSSGYGSTGR